MDMLNRLKEKNPNIKFYSVKDPEFLEYGCVIEGQDVKEMTEAALSVAKPESGSAYSPSVDVMEKTELAEYIRRNCFGDMPTQIGLCWGYNDTMNAMEYHKSSEINLAVTDIVLLLAHVWDIKDGKLDVKDIKGFYMKKGELAEVYATSLHYCPCQTADSGFYALVALPKTTNTAIENKCDNPYQSDKNKWILCHPDCTDLVEKGVPAGIVGENYKVRY